MSTPRRPALWTQLPGAKDFQRRHILPNEKGAAVAAKPPKRTPLRRPRAATSKHAAELRLYRQDALEFVAEAIAAGGHCPVVSAITQLRNGYKYGHPISDKLNEVHHARGRLGPLLRDKRFWIAVSKQGHRWIHSNIHWARHFGWICEAGQWNTIP